MTQIEQITDERLRELIEHTKKLSTIKLDKGIAKHYPYDQYNNALQELQTLRKQKVLLIEDSRRLAEYVSYALHKQGRPDTFPKGEGGLIEKHESLMREVE